MPRSVPSHLIRIIIFVISAVATIIVCDGGGSSQLVNNFPIVGGASQELAYRPSLASLN